MNLNTGFSEITNQKELKHLQITGGEPTVHPQFENIIEFCRPHTKVLGVSTNGSWSLEKYLSLPIDMFSISLDDYNLDNLKNRGYSNPEHIINVIKELSLVKYVNVGLVVDNSNISRIEDIISYILDLGVDDIKLSISTKTKDLIPVFHKTYENYPILNYRVNNFKNKKPMRGYPTKQCHIIKNDITIVGNKHYPCLVYFREKGKAIGNLNDSDLIQQRIDWSNSNDCLKDPICSKFCMDFKCDFNLAIESK